MDPAAEIAGRQHGVVARWQLRAAGLTARAIEYRVEVGRLHAVHRGVYLVGHRVFPPLGREAAAVLACGPGSVLSHRTAAAFWGIVAEFPRPVEITVVDRGVRHRSGVRAHQTGELERGETRVREGMRFTAPARTLIDLAAVVSPRELRWALEEARGRRIVTDHDLVPLLDRGPRRRGTRALRALLEIEREPELTRSEGERRVVELIERAGLPRPRVNARVAGHEVDLSWLEERLVVEVDGYAYHSRPAAFERDRRRDADLVAAGYRVVRVTWRQIVDEPEAVAVRLARVL